MKYFIVIEKSSEANANDYFHFSVTSHSATSEKTEYLENHSQKGKVTKYDLDSLFPETINYEKVKSYEIGFNIGYYVLKIREFNFPSNSLIIDGGGVMYINQNTLNKYKVLPETGLMTNIDETKLNYGVDDFDGIFDTAITNGSYERSGKDIVTSSLDFGKRDGCVINGNYYSIDFSIVKFRKNKTTNSFLLSCGDLVETKNFKNIDTSNLDSLKFEASHLSELDVSGMSFPKLNEKITRTDRFNLPCVKSFDLSCFTAPISNTSYFFEGWYNITELDFSTSPGFKNINGGSCMFKGCFKLERINFSGCNVTLSLDAFKGKKLNNGDEYSYNYSLREIVMIGCDQSSIDSVRSALNYYLNLKDMVTIITQ